MKINDLEKFIKENNLPQYRMGQIIKAIYQDGVLDFNQITTLSKGLREKASQKIKILPFTVNIVLVSKDKAAVKALIKLDGGNFIETVIMRSVRNGWTACVSSQAGCPIGCAFCASGIDGLKRNLSAEEICGQVLFWLGYIKEQKLIGELNNIVYMGMGEPFLNWSEVAESLRIFMDEKLFNFGSRSISISTVGIPEGIAKLAKEFPQVNLALSLHSANNKTRSELVPLNNTYNLTELKKAVDKYLASTNRKVFIEYILLSDINDTKEDADELIKYLEGFERHYLLHVNLITYNQTKSRFKSITKIEADNFKKYLLKNKIQATVRQSFGEDIMAACGQLAGKK